MQEVGRAAGVGGLAGATPEIRSRHYDIDTGEAQKTMCRHREKTAIYKARREVSGERSLERAALTKS